MSQRMSDGRSIVFLAGAKKRVALLAAAACLFAGSAAMGQFVTPPPATNPTPENDIPKAPPPPIVPPAPPSEAPPPRPIKATKAPLPDVKWKEWELVDGKVAPLSEPLELAALRRNPLVTTEQMARIEAFLPDRRRSMERVVVENLDLVERIDAGMFETANFSDRADVTKVVETTKPLQVPSLATDLKNRQIIDDQAFGINSRITTSYTKASAGQKKESATPDEQKASTLAYMRAIYKQNFIEHLWTYNNLLNQAGKAAGVDQTLAADLKSVAVKEKLAAMGLEERKALLRGVAGYAKGDAAAKQGEAAKPTSEAKPTGEAEPADPK